MFVCLLVCLSVRLAAMLIYFMQGQKGVSVHCFSDHKASRRMLLHCYHSPRNLQHVPTGMKKTVPMSVCLSVCQDTDILMDLMRE